ncbi:MAG: zeta toxin family protein [bacterium]|nr:zeta toxin family protein [bacterium]
MDTARRRGYTVRVLYVYRHPAEAAKSVVERAAQTGRIVPPDTLANAHYGANETIRHLMCQYKRDAQVIVDVIDNTGDHPNWTQPSRVPVLNRETVHQQVTKSIEEALGGTSDEIRTAYQQHLRARPAGHRIPPGMEPGGATQRTAHLSQMRSGALDPPAAAEPYRFGGLSQAAQAETARLSRQTRTEPGTYGKVLSAWKASKTVYNPPSWIRNLYQNFIIQYLAPVSTFFPYNLQA